MNSRKGANILAPIRRITFNTSTAMTKIFLVVFSILMFSDSARSQEAGSDSVSLTLGHALDLFSRNNVQLLAAHFNIEASRAAIVQAGLRPNPNLSIEQNVYNQYTGRYFDVTSTGNTGIQVQQLIQLAGKRGHQVKIAEINTSISQEAFTDLLRTLTYELESDFFHIYFQRQSLVFYDESISTLEATVATAETLYTHHSLLLVELLRLKSLLLSLEKERLDLVNGLLDRELSLHILLNDSATARSQIIPFIPAGFLDQLSLDRFTLEQVTDSALARRPDLETARRQIAADEANIELQKALSTPDVTLGGLWSRAGSYIPNYFAITVSIDLPLFNRNQGNIEQAEQTLLSDRGALEHSRQSIIKEVTSAYKNATEIEHLQRRFDLKLMEEYRTLVQGMVSTYGQRNISILEFTDFFESYRTSIVQIHQLENDRVDAIAALNFVTGTVIIPLE